MQTAAIDALEETAVTRPAPPRDFPESPHVVGISRGRVFQAIIDLYCDARAYERMARPIFRYGDGHTAVTALQSRFAAPHERRLHAAG